MTRVAFSRTACGQRRALRWRAVAGQAVREATARPGRSILTALGSAVATFAAITAVALSATSQSQIDRNFDELEQTQVVVSGSSPIDSVDLLHEVAVQVQEWDGVEAVVQRTPTSIPAHLVPGPAVSDGQAIGVVDVVDSGVFSALQLGGVDPSTAAFERFRRGDPVALVGVAATGAEALQPPWLGHGITVAGHRLTVIGVFTGVERSPELLSRVVVPMAWARSVDVVTGPATLLARTRVGAAGAVAAQIVEVGDLREVGLEVSAPPTVAQLRAQVTTQVDALTVALSLGAIAIGSIGIANAALVSVIRRRGELAVRRALGATRRDIVAQVVMEGVLYGTVAGAVGAVLAVVAVVAISARNAWTPVVDPVWVLVAVAASALLAGAASAWPAKLASDVAPADAVREL